MKKILLSTLFAGLMSFQAHADYIAPQESISSQAAKYSVMNLSDLTKAAQNNQPVALFTLGTRYETGKEVAVDLRKAFTLYKAAADQNLAPAQYRAGTMLIKGEGTSKNEQLGRQYLEKAAHSADNRASFRLALLEEANKNYVLAYQWYELASLEGTAENRVVPLAETKKVALAANLTQDQIRLARERAYTWFEKP